MGLYQSMRPEATDWKPSNTDLDLWPRTKGGETMQAYNKHHAKFDINRHDHMQALCNEFQRIGWTWNPRKACRSTDGASGLLDDLADQAREGECGYLAYALHRLMTAPEPWGFAQEGARVKIFSGRTMRDSSSGYKGFSDDSRKYGTGEGPGFISPHSGRYHNLGPNCFDVEAGKHSLYKWGDHAVVKWAGKYWDPSYNQFYDKISDMCNFFIIEDITTSVMVKGDPVFTVKLKAFDRQANREVYFRQASNEECLEHNLPTGTLVGPLSNPDLPKAKKLAVNPGEGGGKRKNPKRCCCWWF